MVLKLNRISINRNSGINRKIPGPPVHVCENDLIVVDLTNLMGGTSATLHWHGIHQRKTPYFDGVPYVTQCPIGFATTFRYEFRATQPGTQFYHSHSGHHKVNGAATIAWKKGIIIRVIILRSLWRPNCQTGSKR